jgi:hypothetical protein
MSEGHAAMARPPIAGRVLDQARPHRIRLDVALRVDEVALALHQRSAVSPLPQRAGAAIHAIDVRHEVPPDGLDGAGDALRRPAGGQDVHVVGHQDVGVHRNIVLARGFAEAAQEVATVRVREEDVLAVVAAHDDVLRDAGDEEPLEPCHGLPKARTLTPNLAL